MAILNGLYVHVTDESLSKDVDTTSHPVEKGIDLTDTVRERPFSLSISGKIVDYGDMKSHEVLAKIKKFHADGSLINYSGRNIATNMQIQSFSTDHPNTNHGGADFDMELKQVRIAKSAYVPKPKTKKKIEQKSNPIIEVGSVVIFKGGPVYVSSDATNAAANRNRSTCKVTIISAESWSVHKYHLISTDGGGVYGWVDYANIEGAEETGTNGKTNAGTQQVQQGNGTAVYYTVKQGDTVWGLVNNSYKDLNTTCEWVIENNPDAFSVKGDARTLKIGAKLLLGYR
ncbi:MAG: FimV family protein [Oscillospiraceae bacterium]|jgi:LysM repeat protein